MKRPPYKILAGLLCLTALVLTRLNSHSEELSKLKASSLESPNGYINVILNLAQDLETNLAGYVHNSRFPDISGQISSSPLTLSDPLIPKGKVVSLPSDPLELKKIGVDSIENLYALFQYGNQFFTVKTGDQILGRHVIKIAEDKVYLSSQMTRYLYHINGKKLLKLKN